MAAKEAELVSPETPDNGKKTKAIVKREPRSLGIVQPVKPSMEEVLMRAVEQGAPIETLERIAKMVEEAQARIAKGEFFAALAEFQSLVPEIPKDKKGYDYYYAPVGTIDRVIKSAMKDCGLSKRWQQSEPENQVTMNCVVSHVGGHSETSTIGPVGWDLLEKTNRMNGLQHRAAVITYLQRYTLIAALGLSTADKDTDARGKISPQDARKGKSQPVSQPKETPTAQKAETKERVQLEPAENADDAIDAATQKGLAQAMAKGTLGESDFLKRFPKLTGLEQVKKTDSRVIMSWIADPVKN